MADEIEPTAAKAKAAGVGFWTRDRLRGWLKEYVIIVVGVLTALAGQEAVEAANWKSKVADAERDLKVELASNAVFAYERLVTVRCATRQIDAIRQALIDNRERGTPVAPSAPFHRGFRPWLTASWESAQGLQLTGHIPTDRLHKYSRAYSNADAFARQQGDEQDLIPSVDSLVDNAGRLSPAERDRLFLAVRRLEAQSNRLDLIAFRYLETIRPFDISVEPAVRARLLKEGQASYGPCASDPTPWLDDGETATHWLMTRTGEP